MSSKRDHNGNIIDHHINTPDNINDDYLLPHENESNFFSDPLDSLIDINQLNDISEFIVPNLRILHKLSCISLRIINTIFDKTQSSKEKEVLLTLLYGIKDEFMDQKVEDEEFIDTNKDFNELVSLFMKLLFGHFKKRVYNNNNIETCYDIDLLKKKDIFLSFGDVFEIFDQFDFYNDFLLLPTPLLYNQFLFYLHNNIKNNDHNDKKTVFDEYNIDFENQIKDKYNIEQNFYDDKFHDLFPMMSNNDDNKMHSYEQLFYNKVLTVPLKVQYHMFQLLQKINLCLFLLISLRLSPHDLTVVDNFIFEAMNGSIQPIRNSKKLKNSTKPTYEINRNIINTDMDLSSATGPFRFFELSTKKLILSSGMFDASMYDRVDDRAIISDGDSYQVYLDEYQYRLYNSMHDGNSVRSIKKLMKSHINILVEFKTQIFIYELVRSKLNYGMFDAFDEEAAVLLKKTFDFESIKQRLLYLKKNNNQDEDFMNNVEQTLIDKLQIRYSNIYKKIIINNSIDKESNINDLIKHYDWFDFVLMFIQFMQKNFLQLNRTLKDDSTGLSRNSGNTFRLDMFDTIKQKHQSAFVSQSTTNSVGSTPRGYISDPTTPKLMKTGNFMENTPSTTGNSPLVTNGNNLLHDLSDVSESEMNNKKIVVKKVSTTRKIWTKEEEAALLQGLKICGPSWAKILELYGTAGIINESLKNRVDLQLKDKARNWKIWFLSNEIKVLPPYLSKVTGGVERCLTKGNKRKNTNMDERKKHNKKNYVAIVRRLQAFLYTEEDIKIANEIKERNNISYIMKNEIDVHQYNGAMCVEIERMKANIDSS
ncbi:unnamed protein product [Hanseniaspora opuntiae]